MYTFEEHMLTEKAFIPYNVEHGTTMIFNYQTAPLIDSAEYLQDHPHKPRFREAILGFAYGYYLYAYKKTLFYILPQGYYVGQGLQNPCNPWHGFNVCYGYTPTLAVCFEIFFFNPPFYLIIEDNLQWIFRLNSGLANESFAGCVIWHKTSPQDQDVPYSFINIIANQITKIWFQIPCSMGIGLYSNRKFEIEAELTEDNNILLHDSDKNWISCAGGSLSNLVHLHQIKSWSEALGDCLTACQKLRGN